MVNIYANMNFIRRLNARMQKVTPANGKRLVCFSDGTF